MRYLYRRGDGARWRVLHIAEYDRFGHATMTPVCGREYGVKFNTTANVPFRRPLCKWCAAKMAVGPS